MATTFFDANGNYYETLTDRAAPEGHSVAPQKPSGDHQWSGSKWFLPEPEPVPDPTLTRPQWAWALAQRAGDMRLEQVVDTLKTWAADHNDGLYSTLQFQTEQQSFRLDVTLRMLSDLSPVLAQIAPGADVSEPVIRAIWAEAAAK